MEGTRFQNAVQIGTTTFAGLALGVSLYVAGTTQVTGAIQTVGTSPELTQSGSNSVVVTALRSEVAAMTATGSLGADTAGQNSRYPIFRWQNPKTQTAALLTVCFDTYTAPSPATNFSCFVNDDRSTGSGGAKYLFKYNTIRKGHYCYNPIGSAASGQLLSTLLVGPDQQLKCGNSAGATSGSGQGLVGDGKVLFYTTRL